jgi:hypothetical protein
MVAYSYGDSRSVNDGGSIAQSIWRDRLVSGDPNEDVTSIRFFINHIVSLLLPTTGLSMLRFRHVFRIHF